MTTNSRPDLTKFSPEELRLLQSDLIRELERRNTREREEAKKKIRELANAHKIDLKDLLPPSSETLLRNPDNPLETWSGKGRKPEWYKQQLLAGKHPNDFKVTDAS